VELEEGKPVAKSGGAVGEGRGRERREGEGAKR